MDFTESCIVYYVMTSEKTITKHNKTKGSGQAMITYQFTDNHFEKSSQL